MWPCLTIFLAGFRCKGDLRSMRVHSVVMRARGPAGILAETTYLDLLKVHFFVYWCLTSFFRRFREMTPIQANTTDSSKKRRLENDSCSAQARLHCTFTALGLCARSMSRLCTAHTYRVTQPYLGHARGAMFDKADSKRLSTDRTIG